LKANYLVILLGFFFVLHASCKKKSVDNPVPEIRLVNVNLLEVQQFVDSLILTVEYKDEDGDLGSTNPDYNTAFVRDTRLQNTDEYFLTPLTPSNDNLPLIGELKLLVKSTFLLSNDESEETIFEIQIQDRAGNKSNLIRTPIITITK